MSQVQKMTNLKQVSRVRWCLLWKWEDKWYIRRPEMGQSTWCLLWKWEDKWYIRWPEMGQSTWCLLWKWKWVGFFGQVMFHYHSDQMSQRSQVSWIALYCQSQKVSEWLSERVSDQWQGHLLSCLWTAKHMLNNLKIIQGKLLFGFKCFRWIW